MVGFAAEHGEGAIAYGRDKLERKALDAIVVNDISRADIGFDSGYNEVVVVTRDGVERKVGRAPKEAVADAILDEVARLLAETDLRSPGGRDGAGRPTAIGGTVG